MMAPELAKSDLGGVGFKKDACKDILPSIFRYFQWTMRQVQTCRAAFKFLDKIRPGHPFMEPLPDGTWKDVLHQTALMIHPPLLILSYSTDWPRYLWSEVLSLGDTMS